MKTAIIAMPERVEPNHSETLPRRSSNRETPFKLKTARLSRRIKKELKAQHPNEQTTQSLDKYLPRLAKNATTRAYRQALLSGSRVLIAEAGELVEVLPNGTRRAVKKIAPSVRIKKGLIIKIK